MLSRRAAPNATRAELLVTGKGGRTGSWIIRGEQLGTASGADVQPMATDAHGYQVAVVIKRTPRPAIASIRAAGIPWAWDVVDAYPQPDAYAWGRNEAVAWVRNKLETLQPSAVIWPNARMREDCDPGLPGLVLPHHHRPGIACNPIRERVQCVGYEGEPDYLGRWRTAIECECRRRGWTFLINPPRMADVDIAVAFRDGGGYVSRHWKSNVKLANAHGSGTPFIGQGECGYLETASGAERWVEDTRTLAESFDSLLDRHTRREVNARFLQQAFSVEKAGRQLDTFMRTL